MASTAWMASGTFEAPLDLHSLLSFWPPTDLESETLTRALQVSISHGSTPDSSCAPSPAASVGLSPTSLPFASDSDSAPARPKRSAPTPPTGRVAKRRPRASKRMPITYIEADPANFRDMVQQITGIQVGEEGVVVLPAAPPLPPPRSRAVPVARGSLPTLDTSAILIDGMGTAADGGVGFEEELQCFPTLDSWGWDSFVAGLEY